MYCLKSAKEHLDVAKILLEAGKYKDSIGRSYYYSPVGFVLAGLFSWAGQGDGMWHRQRFEGIE